jgi:hypothetical protein
MNREDELKALHKACLRAAGLFRAGKLDEAIELTADVLDSAVVLSDAEATAVMPGQLSLVQVAS